MRILLLLSLAFASLAAPAGARQRNETVSGVVVAYTAFPGCMNGNAYWSAIIRIERPKRRRSDLVRLEFSAPCDQPPLWLSAKPEVRRFRLLRRQECDCVLTGIVVDEPAEQESPSTMSKETSGPQQAIQYPTPWRLPAGSEHTKLPFGHVLPCYRSADLPLLPVL